MPVRETLHLKGIDGEFTYLITDVAGTTVRQNTSGEPALNVAALPEGVYILKLQQQSKTYVARFVVMR
jgi:hypothetical protein